MCFHQILDNRHLLLITLGQGINIFSLSSHSFSHILLKVNVFLKDLTKVLKNRCGSGGTFDLEGKEGKIEIQGDKRDLIRTLLAERGIKTKG